MEAVKKCKDAWAAASSDTERFAALLIIMKLLKSSDLTSSQRHEVFNSLGFSFLSRLLHTEDVPHGCPPTIFKSVALAVMACFSTDSELAIDEQMCSMIPVLKDIISTKSSSSEEEPLVNDALDCILGLANHEKGRKDMLENGMICTLVNSYVSGIYGQKKVFQILVLLIFHCGSEVWENETIAFNSLLKKLSQDFHQESSAEKFELCEILMNILLKNPSSSLQPDDEWALEVREALSEILRSKITKEQRDPALKLASVMVDKFGVNWLAEDSENSRVFFLVLVQLVCIEIRMILEDRAVEDISKEMFLLSACYSILECVIAVMIDENLWHSNQAYTEQLLVSIKTAFEAIIAFLQKISTEWQSITAYDFERAATSRELTFATIRVLCSWLAEETFALREEVCKILPFVLKVCKESFLQSRPDEIKNPRIPQICYIDLMRFLVPPLCHLTADDTSRKILLQEELHLTLFEYVEYQWSLHQMFPSSDLEILLTTLCGIFLNIVVLESKLVAETDAFFSFLKFLLNSLPQLSTEFEHLTLRANFSVLGLLITKQYYKRVKSCETSFYRFLSSSVKFLWDAHHVEDNNDTASFVIMREYRQVWNDIMELWFLGMQALSTLLPLMPWIASFLMESGWPQYIIMSLSRVSELAIEGSIKSAYQAFLSALVRVCQDVVPTLTECEAVKVCRKHKLKELEGLLLK